MAGSNEETKADQSDAQAEKAPSIYNSSQATGIGRSMTFDRRSQRLLGNNRNSLAPFKHSVTVRKSMKTPKIFSILALSLDHEEKADLIKAADGLSTTLKLSHFRVSHKLGEGRRHTVVYLARHPTEEKYYAIKSIMKHSLNANTIAAMLLEYQILFNDFHHSHCKL